MAAGTGAAIDPNLKIDAVVGLTTGVVADFLRVLGDVEAGGERFTSDNISDALENAVEFTFANRGVTHDRRKDVIQDIADIMRERFAALTLSQWSEIFTSVAVRLRDKHLLFYAVDADVERLFVRQGWGGRVAEHFDGDYLMVVDTNLGGGKTDGIIEEQIHLDVTIAEDGQIENTVTISRTHHGIEGALFTGVNNVDYVRLYVPKGSELVRASGFSIPDERLFENPEEEWIVDDDIEYQAATFTRQEESGTDVYEEQGKTVFGNWIQTAPSETSKVTFTYRLPFTLTEEKTGWAQSIKKLMGVSETQDYTLVVQKQSGVIDRQTTVSVSLPDSLKTLWKSYAGDDVKITNTTDGFIGLLLQPSL